MFSIIIPTLNAERHIRRLLSVLNKQTIPIEVIVIDSASSDNTIKIAKSYGVKTITIKKEDFDHGGTRNLAVNHATGNIIVFLTQDVMPADDHTIERLTKPFYEDEKIGATYGRQLPNPDATFFASHLRIFNYQDSSYVKSLKNGDKGIKAPFLSNSLAAYRKSVLQEVGLFKGNLILAEDTYVGAKILLAGYKLAYISDAMVYHSHNYTALEEFKRYFDIGVFHKKEEWIMKTFGKAEGEGRRFIKSEIELLLKNKKYHLIPEFLVRNIFKYSGFILGQNYERLPLNVIKKMSMNKNFWNKGK
ncbi:MAG: glycosyltransferase family A protein [Nitrospirota bacterium]